MGRRVLRADVDEHVLGVDPRAPLALLILALTLLIRLGRPRQRSGTETRRSRHPLAGASQRPTVAPLPSRGELVHRVEVL